MIRTWLITALELTAFGLLARKVYRKCVRRIPNNCVAVLFDTRRRKVLFATARETRVFVAPPVPYLVGIFYIPFNLLNPQEGQKLDFVVEDVPLSDSTVSVTVRVNYFLDARDMSRYLAISGPNPPSTNMAPVIAAVAKRVASVVSLGVMVNEAARRQKFDSFYTAELTDMLLTEVAVKVVGVEVLRVDHGLGE